MKVKYLWVMFIVALSLAACDDNTGTLGSSVMPDEDNIKDGVATYYVKTTSVEAGSVYARTSTAFLGKYTDPNFGTFEADFLTQFNCTDSLLVDPAQIKHIDSIKVSILLDFAKDGYFGDPLNTSKLKVYELDKLISEDPKEYYNTSINPADYYDETAEPIGQVAYAVRNSAVTDSLWNLSSYNPPAVYVPLSAELGKRIFTMTQEHPEYFKNSDVFKENVLKGVYITNEHGDGTILYIDRVVLNVTSNIYYKNDTTGVIRKDSTLYSQVIAQFAGTKEVIQANRFQNSDKLDEWIGDAEHTYLKSPSGIFTQVELPIKEIAQNHAADTINSVRVAFTTYNTISESDNKDYEMAPPEYLLMLRKKDMYSFFEENKLPDNVTSYLVNHNTTSNQYVFSNISKLIATCVKEYVDSEGAIAEDEDWNKVMLIPVSAVLDNTSSSSTPTLVAIRHDLRLKSAKMVRGKGGEEVAEKDRVSLRMIYTQFVD